MPRGGGSPGFVDGVPGCVPACADGAVGAASFGFGLRTFARNRLRGFV